MSVFENKTLAKVRNDEPAFGLSVRYLQGATPALMAAATGIDFLFICTEHSRMTLKEAADACSAALATGVTPIVRVCKGQFNEATRLLDNGAMGIVVPHIATAAEAAEMVQALRYPPLGHRGWAGLQPGFGFVPQPTPTAQAQLDKQIMLVAMLESPEGIANADAIAATEGIDALLIGCSDLTIEMGISGQLEHPQLLAAFERVGEACRRHGKAMGIAGPENEAVLARYFDLGVRFAIAASDHAMLLSTMRQRTERLRSALTAAGTAP